MIVDFVLTFFYGFSAIFVEAGSKFGGKWGKRNRFWQQLSGLSKAILVSGKRRIAGWQSLLWSDYSSSSSSW